MGGKTTTDNPNWKNLKDQGPVARKSLELLGPEKSVVKLQSTCYENFDLSTCFNVWKTKRIAKFDALETRRRKVKRAIVATENGPYNFGTFDKQAPCHYKNRQQGLFHTIMIKINRFTLGRRFVSALMKQVLISKTSTYEADFVSFQKSPPKFRSEPMNFATEWKNNACKVFGYFSEDETLL